MCRTCDTGIKIKSEFLHFATVLRISDSYDAKIAKFCNLWTFWPVIQLRTHISKSDKKTFWTKKPFCQILKRWFPMSVGSAKEA